MKTFVLSCAAALGLAGCATGPIDGVGASSALALLPACEAGRTDACSSLLREPGVRTLEVRQALTVYCAEVTKPAFPPLPRGKTVRNVAELVEQNRCIPFLG